MTSVYSSKQRCETVHHDVVNFSTAQSKFSFPKDRRRSLVPASITPTDFNYTLKGAFGNRSPSFGIGERFKTTRYQKCKYSHVMIRNSSRANELHDPDHVRWTEPND